MTHAYPKMSPETAPVAGAADRRRLRVLEAARQDAERAGLLSGERTEHLSVRTTPALVDEAKRRTGISSNTRLVELALAALAAPDPVATFMTETYGALGERHTLEF